MSQTRTSAKHVAGLYLIIVGGAYTLTGLAALVVNTRAMLQASDAEERSKWSKDVNDSWPILISSAPIFAAGIGVHKYRRWGLLLASGMGIVTVGYGATWELTHPGIWDYHTFTIVVPMALILAWTLLPSTWLEFKQRSFRTS